MYLLYLLLLFRRLENISQLLCALINHLSASFGALLQVLLGSLQVFLTSLFYGLALLLCLYVSYLLLRCAWINISSILRRSVRIFMCGAYFFGITLMCAKLVFCDRIAAIF